MYYIVAMRNINAVAAFYKDEEGSGAARGIAWTIAAPGSVDSTLTFASPEMAFYDPHDAQVCHTWHQRVHMTSTHRNGRIESRRAAGALCDTIATNEQQKRVPPQK